MSLTFRLEGNVHSLMETTEEIATKAEKGRPPWEKYGKYRYMYRLLHQLRREMNVRFDHLEAKFNLLMAGLGDWLEPQKDYLVQIVCGDEVDEALLWSMYTAGGVGISPTYVIDDPELSRFKLKPWDITRRIQRMNERLRKELGKRVAEKRGRKWALTGFVKKAWDRTKEEIEAEKERDRED